MIQTLQPAQAASKLTMELEPETEARCLVVLREGLASEEFWPAMHAAEGLSLGGYGAEVIAALTPRLDTETDGQKRCGLARELVRAGDRSKTSILLGLLADPDPYDVIFDDDGKGEIADVVALRITDSVVSVTLYHCKYSGADTPGARLGDLFMRFADRLRNPLGGATGQVACFNTC